MAGSGCVGGSKKSVSRDRNQWLSGQGGAPAAETQWPLCAQVPEGPQAPAPETMGNGGMEGGAGGDPLFGNRLSHWESLLQTSVSTVFLSFLGLTKVSLGNENQPRVNERGPLWWEREGREGEGKERVDRGKGRREGDQKER